MFSDKSESPDDRCGSRLQAAGNRETRSNGPSRLKDASRGNALKHGLRSAKLVPEILCRELIEEHSQAFRQEWRPATPTQEVLVRELARHRAALERVEKIEPAVLRRGAQTAANLLVNVGGEENSEDAMLAAAGTSQALETISRYRKHHERAFLRSLATLREAQASAATPAQSPFRRPPEFNTEEACQAYLVRRARQLDFCCHACSSRRGTWIASRAVWQCSECRQQAGVRRGTVLEGSRISLLAWFRAIALLTREPRASTTRLREVTGIQRAGTVRKLSGAIQRALNSPHATELLAGLNRTLNDERASEPTCCIRCLQ